MNRHESLADAKRTILLLQEELERLTQPPYLSGTVLEIGKKTTRVAIDGQGLCEVLSNPELNGAGEPGGRVTLNPQTMAIIGASDFTVKGGSVATIEEVDTDRIKVQNKGESYFILNALEDVKVGDEVLLDPSGSIAIEKFDRKQTKYNLQQIPTMPWDKIGGLDDIITQIRDEVEAPFLNQEIFARYGRKPAKGILLYGPPGCGKTMIGKGIAYNLSKLVDDCGAGHFIEIKGPEILEKWVGNSEANVRRIYEAARDATQDTEKPVVIFIDEAESILKTRGTGVSSDVYDSIVPQFLAEMDGLNGQDNVITVLATNREDIIDPAILRDGRVDRRIKVPRPNETGATEIFNIYLQDKPLQDDVPARELAEQMAAVIYDPENVVYNVIDPKAEVVGSFTYANLTSGAMLKGIVDRACSYAIKREMAHGRPGLAKDDLESAFTDEIRDSSGFAQSLVKEDWDDVFGDRGRQYQQAQRQGYLVLEKVLDDGGIK